MWQHTIRKITGVSELISMVNDVEGWLFDLRHRSDTREERTEQVRRGWASDPVNHHHVPVVLRAARRELKALPLNDPRDYCFIDFGCGKGRMLLAAAAFPFKSFVGIELRKEICDQAAINLRRSPRSASRNVECLNINALDFEFPNEKMVLYFFNPFSEEVLRPVLNNLGKSLDHNFRDVIVVLSNPVFAHVADSMPHLSLAKEGKAFRIYRSQRI